MEEILQIDQWNMSGTIALIFRGNPNGYFECSQSRLSFFQNKSKIHKVKPVVKWKKVKYLRRRSVNATMPKCLDKNPIEIID